MSTSELLAAWGDATRAAELAQRLAVHAAESAAHTARLAEAAEEIAQLAERALEAAERTASVARQAATDAAAHAALDRDVSSAENATLSQARSVETDARDLYHDEGQAPVTNRS